MKIFTEHPHWTQVLEVCTQLSKAGYRAYLAGGCVRDALMGTSPNDFDIATDAIPDKVQELFPQSIDVGKSFGVIIIPYEGFQIEVATFRTDAEYKDGRRPTSVTFSSPEEDAKRRDFTVNALYYDWVDDKVLDFVGGSNDLEERMIRAVGDPETRFKEDHLRLVRAVRFHAQLGFEIEHKTLSAIHKLAKLASDVSKERVREELLKLLKASARSDAVRLLDDTGLLKAILPSFAEMSESENFVKTLSALSHPFQLTQEVNLWAILFLYTSQEKIKIKSLLKELKCSNYTVSYVDRLVSGYWTSLNPLAKPAILKRLLAELSHDLLEIHRIQGDVDPKLSRWAELSILPMNLPDAWITSDDLKSAGIKEGPRFGKILDDMFDLQLNGDLPDREAALEALKKLAEI